MNKKYDAIDWQSFSQKKDIEEIVKNTKDRNIIQIATTIEVSMAVLSLLANTLFKNKIPFLFALIVSVISFSVLVYLCIKCIIKWYNKNKPGSDIPDVKSMVDLFDNDICYYVLMAESYLDKLEALNKSKNIVNSPFCHIKQFYFMETCFYINKAIYNLSLTSNCIDKLYSTDYNLLYCSRKISYTRLKNIFNILEDCYTKIESLYSTISNIDIDNNYIKLCSKYKESYKTFKNLFKDIDPFL